MDGGHNHRAPPYATADFRQLISGVPPHSPDLFSSHHRGTQPMEIMTANGQHMKVHGGATGGGLYELPTDHSPRGVTVAAFDCGDGGSGRWPRQETLTLLEIRSRLDSRFREANQKGPLWDEISRIMSEEHGYQRTGKKCREKFENLYKYYKKTKEGKASRQDGKHYRFFRQLEALYGNHKGSNAPANASEGLINSIGSYHPAVASSPQLMNANNNQETTTSHQSRKISGSLSLSGSSDFDTCYSSEDNNNITGGCRDHLMVGSISVGHPYERAKKRRGGRNWKSKIKEFIDSRTRKMIEKQEAWAEKMMRAMDGKEQERLARDEEWRRQEIARIDKEHKFWAKERAWIEARDAAIMETLRNLTSRSSSSSDNMILINNNSHLGTACLDSSNEMATAIDSEGDFLKKSKDCYNDNSKCKKDISRSDGNNYYPVENESHQYSRGEVATYNCDMANVQGAGAVAGAQHRQLNTGSSLSNLNAGIPIQDGCLRFLMGEGGSLWENYAMKLNKGEN